MKVLMFGWEFPPHNSGGLGVACQGLARALTKNGEEIVFVLPQKQKTGEDFQFAFAKGVFKTRGVDSLLSAYITSDEYKLLGGRGLYGATLIDEVLRYAKSCEEIIKTEQFDVIHAHDWLSFPAGIKAKEMTGKPLIVHVHATEFDRSGGENINHAVFAIEKAGLDAADHIVSVSEFTKNLLVDRYHIHPDKISVVHNGITTTDYPAHDEDDLGIKSLKEAGYKIVLFLGRLTLQKGPDYFLRAAQKVLSVQPKTMFVVVGSGDMEGQMMEQAAAAGIAKNIIFAGFLRDEARSRIYHSADAYVMPSVSEPFGITALESLLHKTPVVMSKQSGASEVVLHALKTDFWDTDEMADQILSVLAYPSMSKELSENGVREVKGQTWEKAANNLQNIYQNVTHNT